MQIINFKRSKFDYFLRTRPFYAVATAMRMYHWSGLVVGLCEPALGRGFAGQLHSLYWPSAQSFVGIHNFANLNVSIDFWPLLAGQLQWQLDASSIGEVVSEHRPGRLHTWRVFHQ